MWEQIRSNRQKSVLIVAAMGVVLVATGMALGMLVVPNSAGLVFGGVIALLIWLVMWIVTIGNGDDIMLKIAGAKEIAKKDHPQLVNVVEEMAIAASLPARPRIFVVDDPAPNAFATGRNPQKSTVAVTTGLLERMDRDELQGVIGHEIGHIRNRDVALMTTAGIMMGCIVLLAEIGQKVLWYGGGARRSRTATKSAGGGQVVVLIAAIALLILAPLLAQLIYFAMSRRREYLADASSAMFTRYPEGLASALEKLGSSQRAQADTSRVTAPMYIVRPLRWGRRRSAATAFSTHPPVVERVRILRSMAGGAGLQAYEMAYRKTTKRRNVVGTRSLAGAAKVAVREASAEEPGTPRERARLASDAFLSASGYAKRDCLICGAVIKVPPSMQAKISRCPRCKHPL